MGMPGTTAISANNAAATPQRARVPRELRAKVGAQVVLGCGSGHDETRCGGDNQSGHLRHQTVTDGELRVQAGGAGEIDALDQHADGETRRDIDDYDDDAGNSVATNEFGGAVHSPVEVRFALDVAATRAGLVFRD